MHRYRTTQSLEQLDFAQRLDSVLSGTAGSTPLAALRCLATAGLDQLDLPGAGQTLKRWQALGRVAACSLSLVKLYEGHTDARAILAELHEPSPSASALWGVWCAESRSARVNVSPTPESGATISDRAVCISGTKSWCSGAHGLTHALVSVWDEHDRSFLAAVALQQDGVIVTDAGGCAVGMHDSGSVDVHFKQAKATLVGDAGAYTNRAGFWHGAAGIAACWYGALTHIATCVLDASREHSNPYRLAHLGAIDVGLAQCAELLRRTALMIDDHPLETCKRQVWRTRLGIEAAVEDVTRRASRALGAGPLCRDAALAQMMADLPVFVRQSHAEHDQAMLGQQLLNESEPLWAL